jgi:hypothetical protein
MSGNPSWMDNPYTFPGVPLLTPIHRKRRSVPNSLQATPQDLSITSSQSLIIPFKRSGDRPSTAGSTHSSTAVGAAKVKHPYTVLKRGKKHHAYPVQVAPYPLNYEPRILDWSVPMSFSADALINTLNLFNHA